VISASWGDVHATSYSAGKIYVTLAPARRPIAGTNQGNIRVCQPDILLVRNGPLELHNNYTNLIFAFQYAGIPSINSLESIYNTLHRPWVFAQLIKIRDSVGADKFPLIEQMYYSDHTGMAFHSIIVFFPVYLTMSRRYDGHSGLPHRPEGFPCSCWIW
jgi:hypothetical protein